MKTIKDVCGVILGVKRDMALAALEDNKSESEAQ